MDNQSLNNSANVSNQTSNSSTASEVLIRSTQIQAPRSSGIQLPTSRKFDTSGSSHSSTGSQRVRIKAKYLREVPSPFDAEEDLVPEKDLKIPPALVRAASPREPTPVSDKQQVPLIEHPVSHSIMSSGRDVYINEGDHLPHSSLKFQSDSVLVQGRKNLHQLFPSQSKSDITDVRITQYKTGQRRKVMQENLMRKQESKAPIKRYVQPNFINPKPTMTESDGVANIAKDATTVAAMTAAAVAATAPFLKSQSDLELKINGILEKLNSLDNGRRDAETATRLPLKTEGEAERRLQELADLRLLQMEKIQQQQLEWQTRMMSHLSIGGANPEDYRGTEPSQPAGSSQFHGYQAQDRVNKHPTIKVPPGAHVSSAISRDYFVPDNQPTVVKYQLATPIPDASKKPTIRNTHSTQTSPLDTPAPRRRPPLPISKDLQPRTGRGLLEEILRKDAEVNDSIQNVNEYMNGSHQTDNVEHKQRSHWQPLIIQPSSAEKQASDMINELSALKTEMKTAIQDAKKIELIGRQRSHVNPRKSSNDSVHQEARREYDRWQRALDEPAPLEKYLKQKDEHEDLKTHGPVLSSPLHYNAPIIPPSCAQAQALLEKVQSSKANLEANLEMILRGKQEEEAYTLVENMYKDGSMMERARIKKSVDQRIQTLNEEIQRELSLERLKGSGSSMKDVQPVLSSQPPRRRARSPLGQRSNTGAAPTNKKKARAKIDTGLRKAGKKDVVETKQKNKTSAKEKENRPLEKKPTTAPARIPSYEDEDYLTRVYGKAMYSPKRRTMKAGPYLRYNYSPTRPKITRPPAVQLIQGSKVKSTKTQTKQKRALQLQPAEHQFYFDPNSHTALPKPSSRRQGIDTPIQGQLIPMAIPLREPRTGGAGISQSIRRRRGDDDDDEDENDPIEGAVHDPAANVLFTEVESQIKPKPQLKIQSMPNIDIQPTAQPPTIEIIEEEHQEEGEEDNLEDAAVPGYAKSPLFPNYVAVVDEHIEDDPVDELPVPGIAFAGQQHHDEPPYHGPPFPPEPPPPLTEDLPSSVIASDIRRTELLQNQAVQWIEQELMARMVSDMYQRQEEMRVKEQEERLVEGEDSVSDVSSHVAIEDRVGGAAGLQLFVDAGQPVDQGLVVSLIREAIAERIAATLGQQEKEKSPNREVIQVNAESDTEQEHLKGPIKTPEVTPVTSPIGSPPARRSLPSTPAETPTPSENESLQELVVSMPRKMSATDDDLAATIAGPQSPVRTPEQTPPPSPPSRPVTPEASLVSPAAESPLKSSFQRSPSPKKSPSPEPWTDEPPLAEEMLLEQIGGASPAQGAQLNEFDNEQDSLVNATPIPPTPVKKLPDTPVYQSPESSETSESTHDLTSTVTTDRPISEGEWLNGRSEGEVIPRVVRSGVYTSSSEDTILQTEEMEDLTMDEPPSEGEVLPKNVHFHGEPALALLARINQRPPGHRSQAHQSMMDSELSLGEVGIRQRFHPSTATNGLPSAGPHIGRPHQQSDSEIEAGEVQNVRRRPSRNGRTSPGEVIPTRREPEVEDFTLRMSELRVPKPQPRVPSAEVQEAEDVPPPAELPSKIPIAKPRVIQVGSKARSPEAPVDNQLEKYSINEDKANKEDEANEEAPLQTSHFGGTQTLSDFGTRTLTPDALNMDAYLQSGYLTQTFSQSEPATSDFEQTGASIRQNQTGFGLSQTLSNNGGGTLNMSLDSLEVSRNKSQTEKGTRKFMVTLPTAHELEASLSQSDIEIEKDEDEISDVSEIM